MSLDASADAAPSLRRSLPIVGVGVRREPGGSPSPWPGSALYGVMTVLTAWAIGKVTREQIQPAVEAGEVTSGQLWTIFGWVAGVVVINVVGVVDPPHRGRLHDVQRRGRLPARGHPPVPPAARCRGTTGTRRASCCPTRTPTSRRPGTSSRRCPWRIGVIIMLVAGIVQMVLVDPVMAIIGLTVFPALFLANMVFQRAMSPRVARAQQLRAEVSEVAHE